MIDPVYLATGLAFLSGFLAGELISMLTSGANYAAALACFISIILMITARRLGI